ncbi:NAD-dependent epimerase/dehydratase family protein [Nitrosopumilus piranensis]|uniref:NAD-dependent epimerase/dehydratase n=1 Tax=Nitrosopumilus piranensis TaxID=1582439 RepID=A0A0C5BW97_9ARCH|nr:NAD-dependent epimerase/dehydratase family protein [Nitrosopumilus piranensis]AJM91245.1 NAD-dependent epimerase/dehydratase [Nitrosopumilus piranensis]
MNILITGGAGFVGRYLAKSFSQHKITIFDNFSNSSQNDISNIHFIQGDILDYETLLKSSKGTDVMIHLAAKTDVFESVTNPEDTMNVNVNGTINVLKCCKQNKIKKIVFASSAAVYGNCDQLPINEKTITKPTSPYGQSKLQAENEIKKFAKEFGIEYVILRMFNVYGKGQNIQYAGVITKFLENISRDKEILIYGDGKQTRDFISINDIVDAYSCALESKISGTYNIASGKSTSINELAKTMLDVFNKKLEIKHEKEKEGDIKYSLADVSLAQKEIGFAAKRKLRDELISISN